MACGPVPNAGRNPFLGWPCSFTVKLYASGGILFHGETRFAPVHVSVAPEWLRIPDGPVYGLAMPKARCDPVSATVEGRVH